MSKSDSSMGELKSSNCMLTRVALQALEPLSATCTGTVCTRHPNDFQHGRRTTGDRVEMEALVAYCWQAITSPLLEGAMSSTRSWKIREQKLLELSSLGNVHEVPEKAIAGVGVN